LNEDCCEHASYNGKLEVLKYLHENGCPWNKKCCQYASHNRHLEVLKYLHENGCPWNEKCKEMKLNKSPEIILMAYLAP